MLKLLNVTKEYKQGQTVVKALDDVSLHIKAGEMVAITGPSGSGKSTLLNVLGLLERSDSGSYQIAGEDTLDKKNKELARIRNEQIGFVVQDFALVDNYKVINNVMIPLRYSRKKADGLNPDQLLEKLGMSEFKNSYSGTLSGGQKQRVAIARALINDANIILADEPTGSLDKENTEQVLEILIDLNKEGKTIVIVTHDDYIASRCKRQISLTDGRVSRDRREKLND